MGSVAVLVENLAVNPLGRLFTAAQYIETATAQLELAYPGIITFGEVYEQNLGGEMYSLVSLEGDGVKQLIGVRNYNIAVKKRGDEIVFLRRIVPGGADDSFGVEVARLAGLPEPVVTRARAILKDLEDAIPVREPGRRKAQAEEESLQLGLGNLAEQEVISELKTIDVDTLTPIEAMTRLYALCKKVEESL